MRGMAALCVLALTACEVVFPLDNRSPSVACDHPGLLLCLSFEDDLDDGIADDSSGRGLNAATQAVRSVQRDPGELALQVTTDSQVVVQGTVDEPGSTALDLPTPVSYDLWLNFEEVIATRQIALDNEFQYGIQIAGANEFPGFPINVGCNWVFTAGEPAELEFREINASTTLNEWHHVACVYDGMTFRMFHDSVPTDQPATGALNGAASNFLNVGRGGTVNNTRNLTGKIDNVRIWNRALSANDVQLIFMGNEGLFE